MYGMDDDTIHKLEKEALWKDFDVSSLAAHPKRMLHPDARWDE